MSAGLAGKTAVVTGTAHGIGAGIAEVLRADGAHVHGVDKDQADLSAPAAVAAFFARVGPVDVLVNCAGGVAGQVGRPLEEVTDEDWHAVLDANLTTAFLCTRAAVPGMKERRWGRIIMIASTAGLGVSKTGIQAYTSAKAAQIGFTRQMAQQRDDAGQTDAAVLAHLAAAARSDLEQGLWEANASAGGYVAPAAKLLQSVPSALLGDPGAVHGYRQRLRGLPAFLDAVAARYRQAAAGGRTPAQAGVRQAIGQLAGHLARDLDEDALVTVALPAAVDAAAVREAGRAGPRPALRRPRVPRDRPRPGPCRSACWSSW